MVLHLQSVLRKLQGRDWETVIQSEKEMVTVTGTEKA
jgi:hypothetical protein